MFGPRNRGSQTKYRESESQTIPWCPPYKEKMGITPEIVEIDPVLKLGKNFISIYLLLNGTQRSGHMLNQHYRKV